MRWRSEKDATLEVGKHLSIKKSKRSRMLLVVEERIRSLKSRRVKTCVDKEPKTRWQMYNTHLSHVSDITVLFPC